MTHHPIRAALLALACLLSTLLAAQEKPAPDLLLFTNGDQLHGTLVRGVADTIVFHADMAGEITVPLAKVKELRTHAAFAVLRKDLPIQRQPVAPGTLAIEGATLTVTPDPTGKPDATTTLPVAEIGFLVDRQTYTHDLAAKPGLLADWNGSVSAGATIVRSTQNGSTYTAAVNLVRAVPFSAYLPRSSRTTLDFTETYGKITQPVIPQTVPAGPDIETKTDILHADLERDRYLSPRFYGLADLSFDHNFSQGLDLQQLFGLGLGWTPLKSPRHQLDLKADVHYEKQQFEAGLGNQNLIGSLLAENYRRILPRKLVLTESASALPGWNNLNAYSANATVALALPLFQRLGLNLSTTDNFLNNPAPGFRKNSFQFVTGINYTLR